MLRKIWFLLLILCGFSLSGCNPFGVYQISMQQGNIILQKTVDSLRIGMTKSQVEFVAGKPLIDNIFHGDRWDYVQYFVIKGKATRQKNLTIYFAKEDGKVVRMEGDFDLSKQNAPVDILDEKEFLSTDVKK